MKERPRCRSRTHAVLAYNLRVAAISMYLGSLVAADLAVSTFQV
jgi:hypothetical protein